MDETRAGKFGRALVNMLRPALIFYSKKQSLDYIDIVAEEVSKYSFRKRRIDEPIHEGCKWSLEGLERTDFFDPIESALFVKECFDETYNKDRARNMFDSFMGAIENLRDDVSEGTL